MYQRCSAMLSRNVVFFFTTNYCIQQPCLEEFITWPFICFVMICTQLGTSHCLDNSPLHLHPHIVSSIMVDAGTTAVHYRMERCLLLFIHKWASVANISNCGSCSASLELEPYSIRIIPYALLQLTLHKFIDTSNPVN